MHQNHHAAGHKPTCISSKHQQQNSKRMISTTQQHSTPLQRQQNYSSGLSFQGFPPDQLPSSWIQDIKHATEYISLVFSRHQRQQKAAQQLFTAFLFNQQQKRIKQPRIATLGPSNKTGWTANQEQRPSATTGRIPCSAIRIYQHYTAVLHQ
ncbi:hypothetical protein Nepgr_021686 [Nepenthes gracilis]|uniref:Uncharacterized protein n=1 Tax=Nepenthes gracilis TaxID=150966 RepID=A0AAD3XXF9_NEPGR|nr:hypothetical protein Nepgr_021686 [Nepenthes gracilis]